MRKNKKLLSLVALFLSVFTLNTVSNDSVASAEGDWETVETKILASSTTFYYDGSDSWIFFSLSTNDYTSDMTDDILHVGNATYYKTSDYNFLTYVQFSNDKQTYIPLSDLYFTVDFNFFFKDGTFRIGLRRDASTAIQDGTYTYVKVLEGCEFPSYTYCVNGGTKKKYVQKSETISKLSNTHDLGTVGQSIYGEEIPKAALPYNGIAGGWNNRETSSADYKALILAFGTFGVDYLSNNHVADATNQATTAFEIGNKLTINGLSISEIHDKYSRTHVGYDHGNNYFFVMYPNEVLLMNKNNIVPTLHIPENTVFMDVLLPEVTLKFVGGGWIESDADEFKLTNPCDINTYSMVTYPHSLGLNNPHPILNDVPSEGIELAFNINTGNLDITQGAPVMNFDGLYNLTISINFGSRQLQLQDKQAGGAAVQTMYGFEFMPNTDYLFEIKVTCGANSTFIMAINHLIIFNHAFNKNIATAFAMWAIDTTGQITMDIAKELESYKPSFVYGGSSNYDFIEGDPVYNFAGVVNAMDLYGEDISYENISFTYEEGAVSNGRYNAGVWKLLIELELDGYEKVSKEITINVHGNTSIAKIYYDDGDPIEVPIGSKLTPPANPSTYREGDYDYVFDGWLFEGGKWDFANDTVQGDMHLYSSFKTVSPHYIVTVNYEGLPKANDTFSLTKNSSLPFALFNLEGATFEVFLGEEKITSLIVTDDVTITVKYNIIFAYVEAKEATCTEDGNIGYWYSAVYGNYYFADSKGRELINPFIPKFNHKIVHLDAADSTCHDLGNVDCYYCENCHKHFTDSLGEHELVNWFIEKKPHDLTHHTAKDATCSEDGNVEYWSCVNEPGVYYGDSECTIELESVTINAIGHSYLAPTYEWKETTDGYDCVASICCTHCYDAISETKTATKVVLREATCSQEGQIAYSVSFDNDKFNSQTKIVTIEKKEHSYVFVEQVNATKDRYGIKEHYECSECHKCFVKDGDNYVEIQLSELLYKYNSSGCGGSITATSLLVLALASSVTVLLMLKRKEER